MSYYGDMADLETIPLAEVERLAILDTLCRLKGNKKQAARALGIGRETLYRKLKKYAQAAPNKKEKA